MVKNRFYRGKENQVAAVEDFVRIVVPHSLGYVEDGNLVRGYHGLVMVVTERPFQCQPNV